jgi:hypothetical protein
LNENLGSKEQHLVDEEGKEVLVEFTGEKTNEPPLAEILHHDVMLVEDKLNVREEILDEATQLELQSLYQGHIVRVHVV